MPILSFSGSNPHHTLLLEFNPWLAKSVGESLLIFLGPDRGLRPFACSYTVTSSDPNDEAEEDIVHTAAVPARIVQTSEDLQKTY